MRAAFVVVGPECVELLLQLGDGRGGCLSGQPSLEGLVEPFDLALGLRVVGCAVLLADVQDSEGVFERVAAAAVAGSVDAAVVGEGGRGRAVGLDCGEEGVHHDVAGHGAVGGAGQ